MARDSGGNHSLHAGNPVVTLTTIASAWANGTMADLSAEITNSLDRNDRGPMLARLRLFAEIGRASCRERVYSSV